MKCYKFTTYLSQLRATLSYCLIWPVTVYLWPKMQHINDQTPEAFGIIKQITEPQIFGGRGKEGIWNWHFKQAFHVNICNGL